MLKKQLCFILLLLGVFCYMALLEPVHPVGAQDQQITMVTPTRPTPGPVGPAFTYQGYLNEDGSPANGLFDLQFILYNDDIGGSQQGDIVQVDGVRVAGGIFNVLVHPGVNKPIAILR